MIPKYVPISRAKGGEFEAYKQLGSSIKKSILPIFELPPMTESMLERKKYASVGNPYEVYVQGIASEIHNVFPKGSIGIDINNWAPNDTVESGENVLGYLNSCLSNLGCDVIPVIGYDRWEDIEYKTILKQLSKETSRFCIRLDDDAFSDMQEEEYFLETFDDIVTSLGIDISRSSVLFDFGDVSLSKSSIVQIQDEITLALKLLNGYNFKFISIAGCSIAGDINGMVAKINSQAPVVRKEMKAWKSIKAFNPNTNLVFGDYGISNPKVSVEVAPYANGKIRYTISDSYLVVRGYPRNQGEKGAQMHDLCRRLIKSGHYMDAKFSWGDRMITVCANEGCIDGKKEPFKGSTTQWVAIDTTHHMTYVVEEVKEFERTLASIEKLRINN
ncbi:beta family protein [Vibrio parahaemolyticus]|uniref:beta family protein n=1 Tax=Vibrio parahaemolyticus TaxID=670 RepID=UPI001021717E|nr:beta family protein [Vibrio parahaemolyticus]